MEQKVLYQLLKMFVVWAATLVTAIMQFLDQFRSRLISQLIKGTWRVLQKLLRHFNGTIISTFSVPLFPAWSFFFIVLNELVSVLSSLKSLILLSSVKPVYFYNIAIKFHLFLKNYHYILLNYTLKLLHQYHEHHLIAYCLLCLPVSKWRTILNITFLLTLFAAAAAAAVCLSVYILQPWSLLPSARCPRHN